MLALAFGLLTGVILWVVVDRIQTRAISQIFDQALESQLDQQARESLIRFDEYRRSFTYFTRLVSTHRRMADYLDPIIWGRRPDQVTHYDADNPPAWLPDDLNWQGGINPRFFVLVDPAGKIRELYSLDGRDLPPDLAADARLENFSQSRHAGSAVRQLQRRCLIRAVERSQTADDAVIDRRSGGDEFE